MTRQVNLYEAKTQLSQLVEDAARGEEIIIAKNGKPMAKLVVVTAEGAKPKTRELGQWEKYRDPNDKRTPEEWWRDWKALDAEIEREFDRALEEDGKDYHSTWPATSSIPTPSSGRKRIAKNSGKKRSQKSGKRKTGFS